MDITNGIITGIGSKEKRLNLITPELDATVYKWIIGRNCIITGLEIVGTTLTCGVCVAEGYRGEIRRNIDGVTEGVSNSTSSRYAVTVGTTPSYADEDGISHYTGSTKITLQENQRIVSAEPRNTSMSASFSKNVLTIYADSTTAGAVVSGIVDVIYFEGGSYIYGKFVVNHDENTPDRFSVLVRDEPLEYENADILNEAGTFILPLYENGFRVGENKPYIKHCMHADYVNEIMENGSLGAGTTAVTQPVDDNSDKVATTKYVDNVVTKYIDPDEKTVKVCYMDGSEVNITVKFKRKSKKVLVETIDPDDLWSVASDPNGIKNRYYLPIPKGFSPNKRALIALFGASPSTAYTDVVADIFELQANGDKAWLVENVTKVVTDDYFTGLQSGYELE